LFNHIGMNAAQMRCRTDAVPFSRVERSENRSAVVRRSAWRLVREHLVEDFLGGAISGRCSSLPIAPRARTSTKATRILRWSEQTGSDRCLKRGDMLPRRSRSRNNGQIAITAGRPDLEE